MTVRPVLVKGPNISDAILHVGEIERNGKGAITDLRALCGARAWEGIIFEPEQEETLKKRRHVLCPDCEEIR